MGPDSCTYLLCSSTVEMCTSAHLECQCWINSERDKIYPRAPLGLAPPLTRGEMMQNQKYVCMATRPACAVALAVARIMQKFQEWKVDAKLNYVRSRRSR